MSMTRHEFDGRWTATITNPAPTPLMVARNHAKRVVAEAVTPTHTSTTEVKAPERFEGPLFEHDCGAPCCTYLGTRLITKGVSQPRMADLYYAAPEQTTLARWSSEGSDYSSGVSDVTAGLKEAGKIARRLNLTLREF